MIKINTVSQNSNSTVVAEYKNDGVRSTAYQSEAELEKEFIKLLQAQSYEYVNIKNNDDLVRNLRFQLAKLNNYDFSDSEWEKFFNDKIANKNNGIEEKTFIVQEDYIQLLERDKDIPIGIKLIDKENIHNNTLQVINQYEPDDGQRKNRYDVTILVNGLPLVHIELKRRGVDIKEAFNQINRYNRESFWADSGLFEYVQLFVISNGTYTKYYSNTTRNQHIKESNNIDSANSKKTSNSFEFTSWWADEKNTPITDLMDFTKTFFARHTLLNILTKYCVFTVDKLLLVMRPYQIVATEKIINKIKIAHNYKWYGSVKAGGYIWHTTGSGKTLTSFKTAQLATGLPFVKKVMFVVDRKDLDYQTMKEYDKFEKGAANSNTSTAVLKRQLEDPNAKIIITTIQKLDKFIKKNGEHEIFTDEMVFIFDECHRSQFGDMHKAITKSFKKYYLFGFTGTPIFAKNAVVGGDVKLKTTKQAFGDLLHTYTIIDAIRDKNVLPFKVDYVATLKEAENISDKKISDIDRERILMDPKRIHNVTEYILEHFDQKTKRADKAYNFSKVGNITEVVASKNKVKEIKNHVYLRGFNSLFCVASIDMAKAYYAEFKKQMEELPPVNRLKVALIYSFGVNEENGIIDENSETTDGLDQSSRDFLENAIKDYNKMFKTNYDTSSDKFQNYYKDVSLRMKNREIDLLIVVNMFLTGFDATTLNTLWVDKNLRMHGLLQAFSRTNRILNSVKTYGNIVCFRNLEDATNEALALFGDKNAAGIVLLKTFKEYYSDGYEDKNGKHLPSYVELVQQLQEKFPVGIIIESEKDKKEFIKLYGAILKLKNILTSFDEFQGNEILSDRDFQDYHGMYIGFYNEYRNLKDREKEIVNDDIVFEMELIKQININIDYILALIKKYHESNMEDKDILVSISKAIDASMELRNKKDLIMAFVATVNAKTDVERDWVKFISENRKKELDKIIEDENLKKEQTYNFVKNAFYNGSLTTDGTDVADLLPPVSIFGDADNNITAKLRKVIDKLLNFFDRFFNISDRNF